MIRIVVRHNDFGRIAASIAAAPAEIIDETLVELQARIAANAPIGSTGVLHTNIRIEPAQRTAGGWIGRIFMVFYWRFVENGTHGKPGRPFVTPAAELVDPIFRARVRAMFSRRA